MGKNERTKKIIYFIVLTIVCIVWAFPMLWALLTSFKPELEIQGMGFHMWPRE